MARDRSASSERPSWTTLRNALEVFASGRFPTQSQRHIRHLHWYTACRLVIEGGFRPEYITPRPPLRIREVEKSFQLHHDPTQAVAGEHTLFGGLKTKDVDVTVAIPGIGPVIAVSMKGTLNAFRNLTNRMEEAAGDCTNIHLAYPGLVYAFWHIFRGNVEGAAPQDTPASFKLDEEKHFKPADVAIAASGELTSFLARYFFAMDRLSGRRDMRDDPSAYEAVGISLVDVSKENEGNLVSAHPAKGSNLHYEKMFETIYHQYDLRFVYQSPALKQFTQRLCWHEDSPALAEISGLDFDPRTGTPEPDEADAMEDSTES